MRAFVVLALVLASADAHADRKEQCLERSSGGQAHASAQKELDAEWEQRCFGGLWSGLNSRGRFLQVDLDLGVAPLNGLDPVVWGRVSAKTLLLPSPLEASPTSLWAITIGFRAGFFFRVGSDTSSANLANVEFPSIGFLAHTPFDRFRFELDASPIFGGLALSAIDSQAALVAALASSPRDDGLFLPNLISGGRVRSLVRARFDPFETLSLALSLGATVGFAELDTRVGKIGGTTGGAELAFEIFVARQVLVLEGFSIRFGLDVGITSVWPTDVVFPLRSSLSLGLPVNRWLEVLLTHSFVTRSVPLIGLSEFSALGLAVRINLGSMPNTVRAVSELRRETDPNNPPTLPP